MVNEKKGFAKGVWSELREGVWSAEKEGNWDLGECGLLWFEQFVLIFWTDSEILAVKNF